MKILTLSIIAVLFWGNVYAVAHQMQHGFILADDDRFASHLVANGHHSRQTEIIGALDIQSTSELEFYQTRKNLSAANQSYFLFQAQQLDLPNLREGAFITGHIVESRIGAYEPKNIIVKSATFRVDKILLNIANPFFQEEAGHFTSNRVDSFSKKRNWAHFDFQRNAPKKEKHCCDTGKKPCNWKC